MFDTVKVGRIISQKRKEHNMTQMQLADALGISFQAVSNWERGNSMPDISKLPELAELFGCSIEELLGGGASAGNVEKLAKGEGQGLSLGEIAEVAPVLTPEVLDEAVESARRGTPDACGDSSLQEGAEGESDDEDFDEDIEEELEDDFDEEIDEEDEEGEGARTRKTRTSRAVFTPFGSARGGARGRTSATAKRSTSSARKNRAKKERTRQRASSSKSS